MARAALILALTLASPWLLPTRAGSQDVAPPDLFPEGTPRGDVEEGLGLIERGAREMLRGLLDDAAPAIRDAETALQILGGVVGQLDDYERPEILPNGDILIRRRPDAGPLPGADGEVEL